MKNNPKNKKRLFASFVGFGAISTGVVAGTIAQSSQVITEQANKPQKGESTEIMAHQINQLSNYRKPKHFREDKKLDDLSQLIIDALPPTLPNLNTILMVSFQEIWSYNLIPGEKSGSYSVQIPDFKGSGTSSNDGSLMSFAGNVTIFIETKDDNEGFVVSDITGIGHYEALVNINKALGSFSASNEVKPIPVGFDGDVYTRLQSEVGSQIGVGNSFVFSWAHILRVFGNENEIEDIVSENRGSVYKINDKYFSGRGYSVSKYNEYEFNGTVSMEFAFSNGNLSLTSVNAKITLNPGSFVINDVTNALEELSSGYVASDRDKVSSNALNFISALETAAKEGEVAEIYPFKPAWTNLSVTLGEKGTSTVTIGTNAPSSANDFTVIFANTIVNSDDVPHVWNNTSMLPLVIEDVKLSSILGKQLSKISFGKISNFAENSNATAGLSTLFNLRDIKDPYTVNSIIPDAVIDAVDNGSTTITDFLINKWGFGVFKPAAAKVNTDGTEITILGNGSIGVLAFELDGLFLYSKESVTFNLTYGPNNTIITAHVSGTFDTYD